MVWLKLGCKKPQKNLEMMFKESLSVYLDFIWIMDGIRTTCMCTKFADDRIRTVTYLFHVYIDQIINIKYFFCIFYRMMR